MENIISLLIVTGPVGVGKTSISEAVYNILVQKKIASAVIDVDSFRSAYLLPLNDRFNTLLVYKNLASIWPNYAELGIKNLIIPNVIETSEEIEQYKAVIPNASITTIRLKTSIPTLHSRLENRESGDSLKWHKKRAVELLEQFEKKTLEDIVIDTEHKSIIEVANNVLYQWLQI